MLRGTIEVAETFSDGQFGSPKTRSSRRVIPMSESLRKILETHRFSHYQQGLTGIIEEVLTG